MFHIVDDAEFVSEVTAEIIKDHGYKAICFRRPDDYISFVNSSDFLNPVAIFTEMSMPVMNGYKMMNIVSELKPDSRFVIMTGEPKIRSEYIGKACMYLNKPVHPDKLIQVIDTLVRCHTFSPTDGHECTALDNRKILPIENWSCPLRCNDGSSACS